MTERDPNELAFEALGPRARIAFDSSEAGRIGDVLREIAAAQGRRHLPWEQPGSLTEAQSEWLDEIRLRLAVPALHVIAAEGDPAQATRVARMLARAVPEKRDEAMRALIDKTVDVSPKRMTYLMTIAETLVEASAPGSSEQQEGVALTRNQIAASTDVFFANHNILWLMMSETPGVRQAGREELALQRQRDTTPVGMLQQDIAERVSSLSLSNDGDDPKAMRWLTDLLADPALRSANYAAFRAEAYERISERVEPLTEIKVVTLEKRAALLRQVCDTQPPELTIDAGVRLLHKLETTKRAFQERIGMDKSPLPVLGETADSYDARFGTWKSRHGAALSVDAAQRSEFEDKIERLQIAQKQVFDLAATELLDHGHGIDPRIRVEAVTRILPYTRNHNAKEQESFERLAFETLTLPESESAEVRLQAGCLIAARSPAGSQRQRRGLALLEPCLAAIGVDNPRMVQNILKDLGSAPSLRGYARDQLHHFHFPYTLPRAMAQTTPGARLLEICGVTPDTTSLAGKTEILRRTLMSPAKAPGEPALEM